MKDKIFKRFIPDVLKADDEKREVRVVISSSSVDRDNDTIDVNGWDLTDYRKTGGPVLWAHDYHQLPIARATSIGVKGGKLQATAKFPAPGTYEFADTVYRLIKENMINSTSVGFKPKTFEINHERGGYDFKTQSLLEFSFVPVPSNADAIVTARSLGLKDSHIKKIFGEEKEGVMERFIMVTDDEKVLVDVDYLKSTLRQAVREQFSQLGQPRSSLSPFFATENDRKSYQLAIELRGQQKLERMAYNVQGQYEQDKVDAARLGEEQRKRESAINSDWIPANLPDRHG